MHYSWMTTCQAIHRLVSTHWVKYSLHQLVLEITLILWYISGWPLVYCRTRVYRIFWNRQYCSACNVVLHQLKLRDAPTQQSLSLWILFLKEWSVFWPTREQHWRNDEIGLGTSVIQALNCSNRDRVSADHDDWSSRLWGPRLREVNIYIIESSVWAIRIRLLKVYRSMRHKNSIFHKTRILPRA